MYLINLILKIFLFNGVQNYDLLPSYYYIESYNEFFYYY